MTVLGSEKHTNANYTGNRQNCWSGFIRASFVDKWISVCLELCTRDMLSGSWYLWNHALALLELCGPLPYVRVSGPFGSFLPQVLYLELSLIVLWWLVILPERLKTSNWQIYSKNCETQVEQKSNSNQKKPVFIREKKTKQNKNNKNPQTQTSYSLSWSG